MAQEEIMETTKYKCLIDDFESFIRENRIRHRVPNLNPQLNENQIEDARKLIRQFFESDVSQHIVCYGSTSWGTVGHYLYRNENNEIYTFYVNTERIIYGFKTTKLFIEDFFIVYKEDKLCVEGLENIDLSGLHIDDDLDEISL